MARFKAGDRAQIDGIVRTIRSWPANDVGPAFVTWEDSRGGENQATVWADQVEIGDLPVEHGGEERSTLGDLHAELAEEFPGIEGERAREVLAKSGDQPVTPGENAKAAHEIGNDAPEGHLPGPESNLPGQDTDSLEPVHAVTKGGKVTRNEVDPQLEDATVESGE